MTHQIHYCGAGEGLEVNAPDAVLTVKIGAGQTGGDYEIFEVDAPRGPATPLHRTGWAKAYYVLHGRMLVQVGDEAYDLSPGATVTIPPHAWHTFTVLSPTVQFLTVSMSDAMGRFHADLDATVPRGRALEEVGPLVQEVLTRHDVTVAGMEVAP